MPFWSRQLLDKRQSQEPLIVPFHPQYLEESAYAMGVAGEHAVTSANGGERRVPEAAEHVTIPPGQFAVLLTEETVKVPSGAIAFISMKAKWKFRGLVNVSGFHVDPGFEGRLKFSVYNAGVKAIDLKPGERVFLIWYGDLDEPTDKPYRAKDGQNSITSSDVDTVRGITPSTSVLAANVSSAAQELASLRERVGHLERRLVWTGVALAAIASLLMFVFYALGRAAS